MGLDWLRSALVCDGLTVRDPLDPEVVGDADLPDVCLRIHAILGTVERPRCEGRLLPLGVFEWIDTLASRLAHGPRPHCAEWATVVSEFGAHYGLADDGPIPIDPEDWRAASRLIAGHT